jgi:hypothetical protein
VYLKEDSIISQDLKKFTESPRICKVAAPPKKKKVLPKGIQPGKSIYEQILAR